MEWLREHMRNRLADREGEDTNTNVLSLRPQATQAQTAGATALELVERAIQLVRDTEDDAAARHARAETLARNAIEEVKLAEGRVRAAESARRAAAVRIDEVSARLRELESELERSASTLAASEARICVAEERARAAETRATEAESALQSIEAVIRTQILDRRSGNVTRDVARCA